MKPTTQLVIVSLCMSCISALAWNSPSHMAVAGLAYDELSSNQQARLVALIKQHPGLDLVTEGFPDGVPDDRSLVMAMATWPDLAKRSKAYHNNGYEANAPAVTNVTFDHMMHKGWHFIDTPLWLGDGVAPELPPIPQVNAVGVVTVLTNQLLSGESDEAKAYDLGWLLHLVGDIHQPLHAVTGVTETLPDGDRGGNEIRVHGVRGESELHAVWDDILGKGAPSDRKTHSPRLDKDIATADDIIVEAKRKHLGRNADDLDPATWAAESFKMAKNDVYDLDLNAVQNERGVQLTAEVDDTYIETAKNDAKKRIHVAGHRLALILKEVLH